MHPFRSLALLPAAACLVSAVSPTRVIPLPDGYGEALIVPAASPVAFVGFDKELVARFRGRFVLTGTFVYGCDIECEPPLAKNDVRGSIVPDPEVAASLPHWKVRATDIRIILNGGERLAAQVLTPGERAAIFAGKADSVRKHVSIVVDNFNTTIECDSPTFSADFVSLAKPAKLATAKLGGDYGCAWL